MRVAIYARKSSESEDRQVQSLDDQFHVLEQLAHREGYTIVEVLRESKSAKDPGTRPAFQRLIRLIERGKIDGVLVWHINRLARNMIDGGQIAHFLHQGELGFIRTPDRTFRPEDNVLILAIENASATNFIQELKRNVARGMDSKASRGWFPGRAPLGYRNNTTNHEIEPDPERFDLVRLGWDLLLEGGRSVAEVHRLLVDSGLTVPSQHGERMPFRLKSAYDIFTNTFYTGRFRYKGQLLPGAHRPMISIAEFELVQSLLSPDVPRSRRRVHAPDYAGVFRCANCGCQIVADIKTKKLRSSGQTATYTYYRCSGARGCNKRGMREDVITEHLMEVLDSIKLTPTQAEYCRDELERCFKEQQASSESALAEAERELTDILRRNDRLTMLYVDGGLQRSDYERARQSLQDTLLQAESRVNRLRMRDEQALSWVQRQVEAGVKAAKFKEGDGALKRAVIAAVGGTPMMTADHLDFEPCSVLKKIAAVEPPGVTSQSSKQGDFTPAIQSWGALWDEIRTLANETRSETFLAP